ncbi:hypothetical protein C8J56DRAFT_1032797 [Mycena floridula]|nr:hypothetical protein C8J56DRAFT_1032797 [Mycena floridula]
MNNPRILIPAPDTQSQSSAPCHDCPKLNKFQRKIATESEWKELESQWHELESRLRRNAHPDYSPFLEFSHIVSAAREELQCWNTELAQRPFDASLKKYHNIIQRQVSGYESLVAPIRKVPPEILRQIFIEVSAENRFGYKGISIPGLAISQVCFHWRPIAFETWPLWSTIIIDTEWNKCSEGWSDAVTFLLGRSGQYPLTLTFRHLDPGIEDVLQLLAEVSHRWHEFRVAPGQPDAPGRTLDVLEKILPTVKGRLQLLQHLVFPVIYSDWAIEVFKNAPRLHTADISWSHDRLLLPWDQIHNLRVVLPIYAVGSLSQCVQLDSLTLVRPTTFALQPPDTLSHSALRSLTLEVNDWDASHNIPVLSGFTFPSLSSLSILRECALPEYDFPTSQIISLITRSKCSLTMLSWREIPVNFSQWVALLQSLPCLDTLIVAEHPRHEHRIITDTFFDLLHRSTESCISPFLPSLQHLSLVARKAVQLSASHIVRVLQHDQVPENSLTSLKSFQLDLKDSLFDFKFIPPLQILMNSGLKMVIRDKVLLKFSRLQIEDQRSIEYELEDKESIEEHEDALKMARRLQMN